MIGVIEVKSPNNEIADSHSAKITKGTTSMQNGKSLLHKMQVVLSTEIAPSSRCQSNAQYSPLIMLSIRVVFKNKKLKYTPPTP